MFLTNFTSIFKVKYKKLLFVGIFGYPKNEKTLNEEVDNRLNKLSL